MKRIPIRFETDKWGFYITPLIGYSNTLKLGKSIWLGWGRWLFTIQLAQPITKEQK